MITSPFSYRGVNGTIYIYSNVSSAPIGVVQHVIKHSPTGMSWGYGGSGPADCALSILTDFYRRTNRFCVAGRIRVINLYQKFKWEKISCQEEVLLISSTEIEEWLKTADPRFVAVSLL